LDVGLRELTGISAVEQGHAIAGAKTAELKECCRMPVIPAGDSSGGGRHERRRLKGTAIALGVAVVLLGLLLALGAGTSDVKSRKLATELVELHRQWETSTNIPSLYESLTNLPFHNGGVGVGKGWVSRQYGALGIKWEQFYFVNQTAPGTNEWTLYHAWYLYPPGGPQRKLATRKLLTMTTP
jgi:hypothetical protein